MKRSLFTIGHSLRSPWEFVQLLKTYGVSAICDVRSTPFSPRNPPFSRDILSKALPRHRIAYVHMPELGARARDPTVYRNGKVQYSLLADSAVFQEGLKRVLRGSDLHRIALMCSERDPITCHRAILVTRSLRRYDFQIAHIIEPGRLESNEQMELRLLQATGLVNGDFFVPSDQLIDSAYAIQGERIAYGLAQPGNAAAKASHGSTYRGKDD